VNILVTRTKLQAIVIPFDLGSSNLTRATRSIVAQIKASGATAVTVLGYVKPSNSLRADQILSLARANQVRAAVLDLMPEIRVSVQALDRQRNPLCDFAENKCAVITE
jgi:outer membrane protein OmpA-like peptidoglycan-associated protein